MRKIKTLLAMAVFVLGATAGASETAKGMQKDLESFRAEMNQQLATTEAKLKELRAKAKSDGNQAQERTVTELTETRERLKKQLGELKTEGGEKWQSMKRSFSESVDQLNSRIQKALK